jgi:enamine deaminase RidA (YjgF/YER057c/UK114 family)
MVTFDSPAGVGAPNASYAHVAVVDLGSATMLVLAGQVAIGPSGDLVGVGDFSAQARQCFANVAAILGAHGAMLTDVVKTTYYVTDMANRARLAEARDEALGDHLATSTLVEVSGLASPDFLVEIDVMAVVDKTAAG